MKPRLFLISTLPLLIVACCAPYKSAVSTYTQTLQAREKIYYSKIETPELQEQVVLNDASLACLVDKDQKKSTTASPSVACQCSDGIIDSTHIWSANCKQWLGQ